MLIPKNSKDLKGLRDFLTQQRTQACSTAAAYTGPLKQVFEEMVSKIDAWLGQLPKEDVPGDWSLEYQLDSVFSVMTQLSAAASLAALELSKLQNGEQFASLVSAELTKRITAGELFTKESLQTATAAAIKTQVDSGELVGKDRLAQLCSESKNTGLLEGEQKVRTELAAKETQLKTLSTRKSVVQAASLPLPDTEIETVVFGGTDEEFNARKARFETRREDLKKEGIQLNSDEALANLWLEEAAYKGFERTVKSLPQLKFQANPLQGNHNPNPEPGKSVKPSVLVV